MSTAPRALERASGWLKRRRLNRRKDAEEKNGSTWRPRHACDHGVKNPQHFVLRRYGCVRFPKG